MVATLELVVVYVMVAVLESVVVHVTMSTILKTLYICVALRGIWQAL
jgi:hypothetical protein